MSAVDLHLPHRLAGHCGSGAYRDLLEYHGLSWDAHPISEGLAFGLGAGLGFLYFENELMTPPIYVVGRSVDMEYELCRRVGIELDFRQTDSPEEGWAWVRDRLDRGEPTMVWADIMQLDYLHVKLSNTMHDIVICGYDEAAGTVLVADNDRDQIQVCSYESLMLARNSAGFPAPNRSGTWVMDFPSDLPTVEPTLAAAVDRACWNMTVGGAGASGETPGGRIERPAEMFGLAALENFARSYPAWPEQLGDGLIGALKTLRVLIVKAGTGGALFRGLHADFLDEACRLLDNGPTEAAAKYRALAGLWVELAEAVTANADPVAAHAAGIPIVKQIKQLEYEGVDAMRRWLDRQSFESETASEQPEMFADPASGELNLDQDGAVA